MAGQPKKIKDAKTLKKWFEDYKKEVKRNPILKMGFKGAKAKKVYYKIERPLSWIGFKAYVHTHYGVTNLHQYRANRNNVYSEYSPILKGM